VFFRENIPTCLYDSSAALLYCIVAWAGLLFLGADALTKSVSKAAELSKDLATRLSVAQGISVKHPGVSLSTLFRYAPRVVDDDVADFQDSAFLNNLNKQVSIYILLLFTLFL
jgi:glutamate/tyrosine decarboxylase-like PLP-dependent enzyme